MEKRVASNGNFSASQVFVMTTKMFKIIPELFLVCFGSYFVFFGIYHYSTTIDELSQFACGIQFLSTGNYGYESQHPPVARIVISLLPYIWGVRAFGHPNMIEEGNQLLYHSDLSTAKILFLSRILVFPFFLIGLLFAYMGARKIGGRAAGVFSLLFLVLCPTVLTHCGLGTTDCVASTLLFISFYYLHVYLETMSLKYYVAFFFAFTLASLAKVSMPIYFFAAVFFAATINKNYRQQIFERIYNFKWKYVIYSVLGFFLLTWTLYGFSTTPINRATRYPKFIGRFEPGFLRDSLDWLADLPLPLTEYVRAFASVLSHNSEGHVNYFFGEILPNGSPWYFPSLFILKLPELMLLLFLTSLLMARERLPLVKKECFYALAIFGVACSSSISIGLRHILPVLFLLSVIFGVLVSKLWERAKLGKMVLIIGFSISGCEIFLSRANILGYMNVLAPSDKSFVTVDSDFEWGHLTKEVIAYFKEHDIPSFKYRLTEAGEILIDKDLRGSPLRNDEEVQSGWFAVTRRAIRLETGRYNMLSAQTLRHVILGTIEIHEIP